MKGKWIAGCGVIAILLGAGFWLWASEPAIAPQPASLANRPVNPEGARIVALGDCMVCHTAAGGPAYAGEYGLKTPFGTIYSTNITPDVETGIGAWSLAAFTRALRRGVSRDGHLLYPAFPYVHYTRMSDRDIALAYDYLMTRPAVRAPARPNDLPLPLRFRPSLAFWNLLFLDPGAHPLAAAQAAPADRGRYIVDAMGHCASCHSGMNLLGGERQPPFGGGEIDGWTVPALTTLTQGRAPWQQQELVDYLGTGLSLTHGAAKGPMRPVTGHLGEVPRSDVEAIVAYLMTIQAPAAVTRGAPAIPDVAAAQYRQGAALFAAACASCHSAPAAMMRVGGRPALGRSSAVLASTPASFIQTVQLGIAWDGQHATLFMPPFAAILTDRQIADLADFVRRDGAGAAPWPDVAAQSAKLRKENP